MKSKLLQRTKEQSIVNGHATLNYKTQQVNEYYHYIHGELVEFQCNRYKRLPVQLTREEQKITEWRCA